MRLAGKASLPAGGPFIGLLPAVGPAVGPFVSFLAIVCKCVIGCSQSFFFPATAAAYNASNFCLVLGAEFSPLYHSAIAEAFIATAGPPAPPPPPPLLPPLLLLVVTSAYPGVFLKIKNRLSVVMTSPSQCQ